MPEGAGTNPIVIVGGGKAGGTAAGTLRDEGFTGPVVIISREPGIPFGRPPLTKEYLRSEQGLKDWYVRPGDWYEAHDVELRTESVVTIDPAPHTLTLESGRELGYAVAAARSMLGSTAPFDYIHNFWSDQYEHTLQYVGHATAWDDFAVRGSLQDGKFIGFYLDAGVVRAAIGFDTGGDPEWDHDSEMAACARLVARRAQPDRSALANTRTDLRSL